MIDGLERIPDGFRRQEAAVHGTHLSFLMGGHGPAVVLLHGWPQTSHAWRLVMGPLASQGYTVVVPDLRGTGRSEHAAHGYGKDDQAEDVRQLLVHLDLGPEVTLVGHDIGGMVAFAFARRHPEEVRHLALIDLALPGLGLEQAMDVARGGLFHFGLFMTPEVPEMLFEGHERAFFDWWFRRLGADPIAYAPEAIDDATRAYGGREALGCGFAHYRTLIEDGRVNRAWVDDGGTLAMPVLALGGEHSAGTRPREALVGVASDLHGGSVAGSGHFVSEERPAELIAHLTRLMRVPA